MKKPEIDTPHALREIADRLRKLSFRESVRLGEVFAAELQPVVGPINDCGATVVFECLLRAADKLYPADAMPSGPIPRPEFPARRS